MDRVVLADEFKGEAAALRPAPPSGSLKVMAEAKVKRPGGKETQCPTPADPASAAIRAGPLSALLVEPP